MPDNILKPGDVRIGHVTDGSDADLPDQVGVLTRSEDGEVELSLPFSGSETDGRNPHHKRTREWLERNGRNAPKTLFFSDTEGWVTLSDLQWSGMRTTGGNNGSGKGSFAVGAAFFGKPRSIEPVYLVKEFSSTIDGLDEFTGFQSLDFTDIDAPDGTSTFTVKSEPSIEWEANGFKYQLRASVSMRMGQLSELRETPPELVTIHETGATVAEHLEAQRPIRALLILLYGTKLSWRSHSVLSDSFPMWTWHEPTDMNRPTDVLLAATAKQHLAPGVTSHQMSFSPIRISDVGSAGLEKWVELYADEKFRRAAQPAVEVLNGASSFLEPQLMMLAIALDYFGYFRVEKKTRLNSSFWVQKAIDDTGLTWPGIGTSKGIAEAIVRVNNDLKHPNRETNPSSEELYGLTALAKVVVRAQIYDLLDVDEEQRKAFRSMGDPVSADRFFQAHRIRFSDSGDVIQLT